MSNAISQANALRRDGWTLIIAYDRWVVLVLALAAAVLWFGSEPIVFTNDSFGYLNAAKFILGTGTQGAPYYRMPLFPIALVVTGVARYDTFFWFVLVQIALGVVMAMLYHDGLRTYSRRSALVATAVFILTFVPFVYSKSVMTEQIYLFSLILCLSSTIRYIRSATIFSLALVITGILIMMLTRVQGVLIWLLVIPFLLYSRPANWRSIVVATAIAATVIGTYSFVYSARARVHHLSETAATGTLSNSFGKYVFMVPYLDAKRHFGWTMVEPGNGPASAKLFSLTADGGTTDLNRWWSIWQSLDKKIGVAESDDLLLRVTIEAVKAHPFEAAVVYGHNLAVATFRLASPYVWEHPLVTIGNESLDRELQQSGNQTSFTWLGRIVNPLFHVVWILTSLLVVATIGAHGAAWAFCLCLYGYNLCAIAAAGAPEGRVVFYALPLLLAALVTAQSRPWILRMWKDNPLRTNPL